MNKKIFFLSPLLSIILTLLSYFKNNAGQCCDLIFLAGWPWPFYGGSGGFIGFPKNRIFPKELFLNLIFWTTVSFLVLLFFEKVVKKSKVKITHRV